MDCRTKLGNLIAVVFQTFPGVLFPLLREGFGRRVMTLWNALFGPVLVIAMAAAVRWVLPHKIAYAPLYALPPFGFLESNQALMHSAENGLPRSEVIAFSAFAALLFLVGLAHYVRLLIARWRETDPVNTQYWGTSLLLRLPVLSRVPKNVIQSFFEPAVVFLIGYALCAVVPVFGMYLIFGSFVIAAECGLFWRSMRIAELDARDALSVAGSRAQQFENARRLADREEQHATHPAISPKTVSRVQTNPHVLLALDPEETRAVREVLGSEAFADLVDQLPAEAQQAVYLKAFGIRAVPQRAAESA